LFSAGAGTSVREAVTLRVFCDEYKSLIKSNRSHSYYKSVETALNHLTDYFGLQRPISSLSHKDIEQFVTHLQQTVKKGYRVYYRTLKAAFNKALDWQYINENFFVKIKLPKKQRLQPVFISEDELEKIITKIESDVVRDVTVFAFYTGLRLNEIVNLKWRNVDLDRDVIVVGDDEFETKGRNQRVVPVSCEVEKILEKRAEHRTHSCVLPLGKGEKNAYGYVFAKANGGAYSGDYFSRRFKRAVRDAGLRESVHFHTLRHSFASHLAQRGVSIYVIKELLGHSSISTTEIYSHLNVDSLREAVNKLDERPATAGKREIKSTSPLPSPYKGEGVSGLRLVSGGKQL
jgi:site-specific recombinase XerD